MSAGAPSVAGLDLHEAAERWARATVPGAAGIADLGPMPGNAGLSFGFTVRSADGTALDRVVLRLAPPGVRRSGNTDVLRQVPLLDALGRGGIPVAPVLWSSGDESWFGTDAMIQRRLDAEPLHMYDSAAGVHPGPAGVTPLVRQAAAVLADVHRLDHDALLPGWERPRGVEEEIGHWWPLMERAAEPAQRESAEQLRARLLATAPAQPEIGLFHGDFQTNNVLYDRPGTLQAVIDWEIAGIGLQGMDVGWLTMMTSPEPWGPEQLGRMKVLVPSARVLAWYEESRGRSVEHVEWYRALACYRFAAIAAFNLRLHRTGCRVDPSYELLASSVPTLMAHALDLV